MMEVWRSIPEWQERRRQFGDRGVGFVPTMGALHRGHMSLVERCRRENEIAVVSIFVNPTQFNDPRDLEKYPVTLDRDIALLREAGVDAVLMPAASEMYPRGYRLRVESTSTERVMEEAHRPGFLQGVMTVVLKLFQLVRADRAYFGEKDFQQLRAIQDLVEEFFIPTQIVACPTVREDSGLAESSRNTRLSAQARSHAAAIYRVLHGATSVDDARVELEGKGFTVDYVEEHWNRRFAAAFLEGVRLIDNV
jgi:pantoate--beta-alanine ligase